VPVSFWAGYGAKLAIVALVLAALYLLARRLRETRLFASPNRCVSVIESTALSQHAAIHVLRVGTRYFLVGATNCGIATLAELEPDELPVRR
jgi:flagellar biogenesis protein FliO